MDVLNCYGSSAYTYEESKRWLGSKFALEGHVQCSGGGLLGNRGKGSGRAGKDSSDGELHLGQYAKDYRTEIMGRYRSCPEKENTDLSLAC